VINVSEFTTCLRCHPPISKTEMKGCTGCCNVPPNFVAIANLVLAENICHSPFRHKAKSAEDTSEGAAKISMKSEVRSYGMVWKSGRKER
jgi:hypothetical protein